MGIIQMKQPIHSIVVSICNQINHSAQYVSEVLIIARNTETQEIIREQQREESLIRTGNTERILLQYIFFL